MHPDIDIVIEIKFACYVQLTLARRRYQKLRVYPDRVMNPEYRRVAIKGVHGKRYLAWKRARGEVDAAYSIHPEFPLQRFRIRRTAAASATR